MTGTQRYRRGFVKKNNFILTFLLEECLLHLLNIDCSKCKCLSLVFWYSDFVTKFEFWFCCLHITKHVEINSSFILLLFFLLLLVSFQFLNVFCCCILSILCSRISVYCVLSWSHELWAVTTFSVLLFSSVFPQHFVCFIFLFMSSLHTEYSTSCCIAMASVAPACLS